MRHHTRVLVALVFAGAFLLSLGDAQDERSSMSEEPSDGLPDASQQIYESLLDATKEAEPWKEIKIEPFDVESVSAILQQLILDITTPPTLDDFLNEYESLGHTLPQRLDLAGLRAGNPANASDWDRVVNVTSAAIANKNDLSSSLWNAVVAYADLTALEASVAKAEDMNDSTRARYKTSVQTYFSESAVLARSHTALTIVEQINVTQMAGKFIEPAWILELIQPPDAKGPSLTDVKVFREMAMLKVVAPDAIVGTAGLDLGGGIATKYITTGSELLSKGQIVGLSTLMLDPALRDYSAIAQAYCKPQHTIRFCLIKAFADQGSMLAALDRSSYNANAVTKLPKQAADLNRQEYLEILNKRVQKQVLSLEIAKMFDELQASVNTAATDLTKRSQDVTFEKTVQHQEAIRTKMADAAKNFKDVADGDLEAGQAQLKKTMEKVATLMKEVETVSEPYLERVKAIAEKALKEAESKQTRGIFGFITKVLSLFNPINWVTAPGLVSDILKSGNQLRKSKKAVDNAKGLIEIIQNSLLPQFENLLTSLETLQPKIEAVAKAAAPIVNATDSIDRNQLQQLGSEFLRAFAAYESPLTATDIDVLEELFINIQTEMCEMAKKRAVDECSAVKTDVVLFDKLSQSFTLSAQALDTTVEIARNAVAQQSAKIFKNSIERAANDSSNALDALQDEWKKDEKESKDKWTRYLRRLEYQRAIVGLNAMASSVLSSSSALMACNFLTYLNGGVSIPQCIPMYKNPAGVQDLKEIIAFRADSAPEKYNAIAYIPTMPSSTRDVNYIALERLMSDGLNVTFKLPQDTAWLRRFNWVPAQFDIKNTVAFIKKFQVILPPKTLITRGSSAKQTVSVVTSATISDLGPAVNNKVYEIPRRQYKFQYEESDSSDESCSVAFEYPYLKCNSHLLKACPTSEGIVDGNENAPLPSLFSPLSISTRVKSHGSKKTTQLSYTGVRGSAPIAVSVTLLLYPLKENQVRPARVVAVTKSGNTISPGAKKQSGEEEEQGVGAEKEEQDEGADEQEQGEEVETETSETEESRRRLRVQESDEKSGRCCKVGSYLADWKTDECAACPTGLISQLGGLYCVRPSSAQLRNNQ